MLLREAAIVSATPGTTRDPVEVSLDLAGHKVRRPLHMCNLLSGQPCCASNIGEDTAVYLLLLVICNALRLN